MNQNAVTTFHLPVATIVCARPHATSFTFSDFKAAKQ